MNIKYLAQWAEDGDYSVNDDQHHHHCYYFSVYIYNPPFKIP